MGGETLVCGLVYALAAWAFRLRCVAGDATSVGVPLAVVLLGNTALGVVGRLNKRPPLEPCPAVLVVSLLYLTEFFRIYVVDFFGTPPTLWMVLRETVWMNAPCHRTSKPGQ